MSQQMVILLTSFVYFLDFSNSSKTNVWAVWLKIPMNTDLYTVWQPGVNYIEAEFNDICTVFCYDVIYISIDTKLVGVVDNGNY